MITKKIACYHEAGHAVVGAHLGLRVASAEVSKTKDYFGDSVWGGTALVNEIPDEFILSKIWIALAGVFSELLFAPVDHKKQTEFYEKHGVYTGDLFEILPLLDKLETLPDAPKRSEVFNEIFAFLKTNKPKLRRVARALAHSEKLSEEDLRTLLK